VGRRRLPQQAQLGQQQQGPPPALWLAPRVAPVALLVALRQEVVTLLVRRPPLLAAARWRAAERALHA
jgi:hypothetical protein